MESEQRECLTNFVSVLAPFPRRVCCIVGNVRVELGNRNVSWPVPVVQPKEVLTYKPSTGGQDSVQERDEREVRMGRMELELGEKFRPIQDPRRKISFVEVNENKTVEEAGWGEIWRPSSKRNWEDWILGR